jgi:hypothetical protein
MKTHKVKHPSIHVDQFKPSNGQPKTLCWIDGDDRTESWLKVEDESDGWFVLTVNFYARASNVSPKLQPPPGQLGAIKPPISGKLAQGGVDRIEIPEATPPLQGCDFVIPEAASSFLQWCTLQDQ